MHTHDQPAHDSATAMAHSEQADCRQHLRQLFLYRNIAIVGQTMTVLVVHAGLGMALPLAVLAALIGALALFNVLTLARLRSAHSVTRAELLGQLLVDVGVLTGLLYFTGGATNPFVGLYLLPLTLAAACLPGTHTWLAALATMACCSFLVFFHHPLPSGGLGGRMPDLLVSGMWLNYVLSAGLIAFFVVRIATALREHERAAAAARARAMDHEYLVRLGTIAAGAAHELGTPLATMSVLVNELQRAGLSVRETRESLETIAGQIDACKRTLFELMNYGKGTLAPVEARVPLAEFIHGAVGRWRLMRPGVCLTQRIAGPEPGPQVRADVALGHAILNLLNNAADVSPEAIELECTWDTQDLNVAVRDRGPGIAPELVQHIGRPFFTTKGKRGSGIGLMLAQTTINRLGGEFAIANRSDGGGAQARFSVPLHALARLGEQGQDLPPGHSMAA